MKKILTVLVFMLMSLSCSAATHLKVTSLNDFSTNSPSKTIDVKLLDAATLGKYEIEEHSILHCNVVEIVDPKRGKRNATFFVQPAYYTTSGETIKIEEEYYGKYSKTVLSKEELKKIPPSQVAKKAVLTVGNHFVKGLSIGVSFVEGIAKNQEDNRLKSGLINAYEESPLAYVEEGEQLEIKVGDEFYLVFKIENSSDEPNYEYVLDDNN